MLNTDSGGMKALIWLSIFFIFATFAWSFWALPAPGSMLASVLASDAAEFAARNQFWLTGLTGFGGASLAYILNGWRDRAERRHVIERAVKQEVAVLAREAHDLAAACEAATRALASRNAPLAATVAELKVATAINDHHILAASSTDIARLGPAASSAARAVRSSVRRMVDVFEPVGRDESSVSQALAARVSETSRIARQAAEIFAALATGGPAATDRIRRPSIGNPIAIESPEANAEAVKPARLHSAA